MIDDPMNYGKMVEEALRKVIRDILQLVSERGLHGGHHFYITCRTGSPDLILPGHLQEAYPDEITLVLQHQYWDLLVGEDFFEVTLSFNGKNERLNVPLSSIIGFVDPSVEFGLQLKSEEEDNLMNISPENKSDMESKNRETQSDKLGEKVVSLDNFRRN